MSVTDADVELLALATEWSGPESDLNVPGLAALAEREGLEFATKLLYGQLLRRGANARFLLKARANQNATRLDADLLGIVPGAFYREHRDTGADGARILAIAREMGCAAEVIPTGSLGTLAENARAILDWLAAHRGRRIALLSLCKGGADLKQALALPGAAESLSDVATWISLSGLVHGTPLIEWLRRRRLRWWSVRLLFWWRGYKAQALEEMRHGPGSALAGWPEIPAHLSIVHAYGFPLQRHLSHPWAAKAYTRLAPLGPNDGGGILLADLLTLPGVVCPIWGADHYLMPPWNADSLLRGIVTAALIPEARRHASQSAIAPTIPPATKSST